MSERKQRVVDYSFSLLDLDGKGLIKISNLAQLFNVSKNHPESSKKSRDQLLHEFLEGFSQGSKSTGVISKEEWQSYYIDVAMSIPSDETFVKFVESTW